MLSLFGWLRRRASESIFLGVSDAIAALDSGEASVIVNLPQELAERLNLPASSGEDETQTRSRKKPAAA